MTKHLMTSFLALGLMAFAPNAGHAQQASICQAIAQNMPDDAFAHVQYANVTPHYVACPSTYEVAFSYQGHSTYLIESGAGVKIATDYAGWMIDPVVPDIVTMNQAHSSHFTRNPNPAIPHVLPGWGENGTVAEHYLAVEDVVVRNVTTDIIRYVPVPDGNSIFIFEIAGLCIGHLGHLHHALTDSHYAKIGRLDVVMVPVDGGLTLTHNSVRDLLTRLRSSVVLPMHVRSSGALPRFLAHLGEEFAVQRVSDKRLILSLRNLPKQPTVMLMPGVSRVPDYSD